MPESAAHLVLVQQLVLWVGENCPKGNDSALFVDDPWQAAVNKPPSILGYFPDVFWKSPASGSALVGEAKSAYDLESRHSRRQFASFLTHLKSIENGMFLIAVPWHVVPPAKSLIRAIQRDTETLAVRTIFLEYLPG